VAGATLVEDCRPVCARRARRLAGWAAACGTDGSAGAAADSACGVGEASGSADGAGEAVADVVLIGR
jgi:hypothetical protein